MKKESFNDYLNGTKKFIGPLFIEGTKLSFILSNHGVVMRTNFEGLLTFSKYLIDFAWDQNLCYPHYLHLYPSDSISFETLDNDSCGLVIKKEDFDYKLLKKFNKNSYLNFQGNKLAFCYHLEKIIIQGNSESLLRFAKELIDYAFFQDYVESQILNEIDENYLNLQIKML